MEYLWRHPHALARTDHRRAAKSSSFPARRILKDSYPPVLLEPALLVFLAHALVLALLPSRAEGHFLSNLLQFILGLTALLAMIDAGYRPRHAPRRIWFYAAAAIGTY